MKRQVDGSYTRTQNWDTGTYYPHLRSYDICLRCIFVQGFVCSFLALAVTILEVGCLEDMKRGYIFEEIWDQCQVNL